MEGPGPILCAHLLRKTDERLLELLASLRPDEWEMQTVAPVWQVRDVAAEPLECLGILNQYRTDELTAGGHARQFRAKILRKGRQGVEKQRLRPGALPPARDGIAQFFWYQLYEFHWRGSERCRAYRIAAKNNRGNGSRTLPSAD